jgi:hypothetical protein
MRHAPNLQPADVRGLHTVHALPVMDRRHVVRGFEGSQFAGRFHGVTHPLLIWALATVFLALWVVVGLLCAVLGTLALIGFKITRWTRGSAKDADRRASTA